MKWYQIAFMVGVPLLFLFFSFFAGFQVGEAKGRRDKGEEDR